MAWKETDLVADLSSKYFAIDATPSVVEVEDSKGVTWMSVNVLENGISENERVPIAYRKNIPYYVYHRGLLDEQAWYSQSEPTNSSATDISSATASFLAYTKLYEGQLLRRRILGWIMLTLMNVLDEADTVTHHSMRVKWAQDALKDPSKYLNAFMCFIAMSPDVRVLGNAAADSDLTWLAYMLNGVITAFGFTD